MVGNAVVTRDDASLELRSLLWRRSIPWESQGEAFRQKLRREAVDACIERHLLAEFANRPPHAAAVEHTEINAAYQQFIKQFEPPDGWKERLELQRLTEAQLRQQLAAELAQSHAIEHWLETQRPAAQIGEQAARAWFEANREKMRIPERALVSHIFLTAHDAKKPDRSLEMAEVQRRLTMGEATFQELAAQVSDDDRSNKSGGNLGWFSRDRVPKDFADVVFSLPVGQPSGVFRTRLGWHIALVHEKRPSRLPTYLEAKAEVLAMLESRWRAVAVAHLRTELRAKAYIKEPDGFAGTIEPAPW